MMIIQKKSIDKLIILLFFCSVHPVIFKHINPFLGYPLSFITLAYSLISIIRKPLVKISKNRRLFLGSLSIFSSWLIILSLVSQRQSFLLLSLQFLSIILMLIFAYSIDGKSDLKSNVANFFALIVVLGASSLFLAFLFKPSPFLEFNYSEQGVSRLVFFTFSPIYMKWNGFLRFAGIFEEPGTLVTFILIILSGIIPLKEKLKNTKIVIIFLTFFNASLGYLIAVFTFLSVYFTKTIADLIILAQAKKRMVIVIFFIISTMLLGYILLLQVMPLYLEMRVERLNNIANEGRFLSIIHDYNIFRENPFFGESLNKISIVKGNNPISIFTSYGIFGAVFYYLPFSCYLVSIWKKEGGSKTIKISIILSLLTLILHRPEIVFPSMMFIMGIYIE